MTRLKKSHFRAAFAGLVLLLFTGTVFADQFYHTRMSTGSGSDVGATGLFLWNDATNAQSQIGGDAAYLRHATDGPIPVDGIATNLAGTLYGFAIDDISTAGSFIPLDANSYCTANFRSRLVSINTTTAVMTYVGASWLSGRDIRAAGFDGQGRLWALDCVSGDILQISTATGAIVGTPLATGVSGSQWVHADIDFAANGLGIIGNGGLQFRVFDPAAGWVANTAVTANNNGFDSTLVPPYIVGGLAFTSHLTARNGSPAAQTCRLNMGEMRSNDELGHVNDPFFANPATAHKDVNAYNPPNRIVSWFNGGTGDMARVGGPALPSCFYDWGDAPSSYGTLRANTGARHSIVSGGPYLGTGMPDFEVDGLPNTAASGDNAAGTDDETGVVVPVLTFGNTVQIQVQAGGVAAGTRLQGWIDWGRDGSFAQAGDQILTNATVVSGINTFNVTVPATAVTGTTYARFRIANQTGLGVTGLAASGEVEDYQVQVAPPPSFGTCSSTMYLGVNVPTQLHSIDTSTNPLTYPPIGSPYSLGYNAMGYDPVSNYIFATQWDATTSTYRLLRIGSNGSVQDTGAITGGGINAGPGIASGEVGTDGFYYVKLNGATNQMWRVNLTTRAATLITLSQSVASGDIAWYNGQLYAQDHVTGFLNAINPTTGAVTRVGPTGFIGDADAFGSMIGASNGVFGRRNSGGFYKFDTTTGRATLISDAPAGGGDGAKCASSPVEFPADLMITKDDGSTIYTPGTDVVYTIVVSNDGPFGVQNALVADPLPTGITTASWTCATTAGGGVCGAASGTGAINTTASLPVDASVTYTLTLNVPPSFSGNLVNTATVTAPAGSTDSNTANNSASDTDAQFPAPAPNVANISCASDVNLFNTAYDGAGGRLTTGTDTYWQVGMTTTNVSGAPPADLTYNTAVVVSSPPAPWSPSPYGNANWVSHNATATVVPADARYDIFYRYQFNVAPGVDPTRFDLEMDFYVDNSVYEVWVNGVAQGIRTNYGATDPYLYAGFVAGNQAAGILAGPWNSGLNEIVVHVKSQGPQGLLAQIVLPQTICEPATVTLNKTTRLVTGGPFGFGLTNTAQATGSVSTTAVDAPAQVDGDTASAGTAEPFAVTAFGTDVVITENALPTGWLLSDAICTSGGTPIGSRSGSAYVIPGSIIDANAESFECTFTNTPTTNLSIDKAVSPTAARAGDTVTYTIAVANDGPGPGDGAIVADPPVAGVDCAAATLSCSASGGAVCPASLDVENLQGSGLMIPSFPAGGALQFAMACTVTATGQ